MRTKSLPGFTLIELIVVMAIIVTLSVIGFISYNSYVRDSRNATRTAMLDEATTAIERFLFTNGRAPRCATDTAGATANNAAAACYFTLGSAVDTKKATAIEASPGNVAPTPPSGVAPNIGLTAGTGNAPLGIFSTDWNQLNIKSLPLDPRGVYYLYLTDGSSRYALFATKEESNGYSTMVKAYKDVPLPAPTLNPAPAGGGTDAIGSAFGFTATNPNLNVYGYKVTNGAIDTVPIPSPLLYDGNTDRVPYRITPDAS